MLLRGGFITAHQLTMEQPRPAVRFTDHDCDHQAFDRQASTAARADREHRRHPALPRPIACNHAPADEHNTRLNVSTDAEYASLELLRSSRLSTCGAAAHDELERVRHLLRFAEMFPMGVSIVNDYSFGTVRFGARAFKCGMYLMALLFSVYVIWGGYKMAEDPVDTAEVHRESVLWTDHSVVPLPFIAVDGAVEALQVSATMHEISKGNFRSKSKTPAPMHACDVVQRQRTIEGANCIHGLTADGQDVPSVVGTFGDPLYRCEFRNLFALYHTRVLSDWLSGW